MTEIIYRASNGNILKRHKCVDCGKERYIRFRNGKPVSIRCRHCGTRHGKLWKGGKYLKHGYVMVLLKSSSPYYSMRTSDGYVQEHRLVMAESLGRCLIKSEMVHHKNGIKIDNRLANLELLSKSNHSLRTKLCSQCELRREIRLLRWQIKEQSEQIRNLTLKLMNI